jgi:hypothetical protein
MQLPHERSRRGFENQLPEHGGKSPGRNGDDEPEDEAGETRDLWIMANALSQGDLTRPTG